MLRQVFILKDGESIYEQHFGKGLDQNSFELVNKTIMKEKNKSKYQEISSQDFFKFRISFGYQDSKNLTFMFVSDLTDKFDMIKKELVKCRKEFMLMFEDILDYKFDKQTFEIFNPTIESIHKNLRPKISLVGYSGVGKTTLTRLIRNEEIPTEHVPTITGDIATIKIGNLHFHLWDFAGQESYSFLWNNFVKGSDAVIIITDSTLENCEKSRFFIDLIRKECPNTHQAVLGNKQDLPDALPIKDIERILEVKTYSMVAVDPENRNKMITIIADILEMSSEISPLLAPLIIRDEKVESAEKAIEAGDFQKAAELFEEVSDLCLTLGDDTVSQDFHQKALKIRKILKSMTPKEENVKIKTESEQQTEVKEEVPPPGPPPSPPQEKSQIKKPPLAPPPGPPPTPPQEKPQMKKPQLAPPPGPPPSPPQEKSQIKKPPLAPPPGPPPTSPKLENKSDPSKQTKHEDIDKSSELKVPENKELIKPVKPIIKKTNEKNQQDPPILKPSIKSPIIKKPTEEEHKIDSDKNIDTSKPEDTKSHEKQKREIKSQILDLKIKITNTKKILMDLEMENIMGTLSDEDFKKKTERLEAIEKKIHAQIEDLEKYIK
jgi:small GTP-binding protein